MPSHPLRQGEGMHALVASMIAHCLLHLTTNKQKTPVAGARVSAQNSTRPTCSLGMLSETPDFLNGPVQQDQPAPDAWVQLSCPPPQLLHPVVHAASRSVLVVCHANGGSDAVLQSSGFACQDIWHVPAACWVCMVCMVCIEAANAHHAHNRHLLVWR